MAPINQRRPIPRSEALLDAAVEYTFPASDPISIDDAFSAAREREPPAGDAEDGRGEIKPEADGSARQD